MNDLISRQAAIDEIKALYEWHDTVTEDRTIDHLKRLPSAQPETHDKRTKTHACDLISRQAAINALTSHIMPHNNEDGTVTIGVLSKSSIKNILNKLPSAQPDSKETSSTHKALDTISRQDAIDAVQKLRDAEVRQYGKVPCKGYWELTAAMNAVRCVPSAQPEQTNSWYINSWCIDCKEYDTEKHSCPRFNRVIKQTLDDAYRHGETEAEARFHAEIVRCKDCEHQVKEWRDDKRLKDKGYWAYGCKVISEICGYWALLGQDDDYCSMAKRRTDE